MRPHSSGLIRKLQQRGLLLATGLLWVGSIGCSGGTSNSAAPAAAPAGEPAQQTAQAVGGGTAGGAKKARGRDEIYVDDQGQKWFGNVPYDVFFDDPLAVAANQAPATTAVATAPGSTAAVAPSAPVVAVTPASAEPAPATTSAAAPPVATAAAASPPTGAVTGASGWAGLITLPVLEDEVKNIRNFLNENLQSVGNYNGSMLMIPPKAAALAVLAGVAMEHPEAVSWKDDAAYVRDLAKQMNADALQRGAKDQKRLLALYEALADTLNRSRPAGLAEPPAGDSFSDVAEMRLVMMRMEDAEKRMRTEAGSAASFGSGKAMVQHEAAILATMSHTITLPGYGYEDDREFVGYGQAIVEAAKSILAASESGDFATYEVALSKISTTCQSCHSKYKND